MGRNSYARDMTRRGFVVSDCMREQGEMLCDNEATVGENGGPFQNVPQFADIPGPVVLGQSLLRFTRDTSWWAPDRSSDLDKKSVAERKYVVQSLA